MTFTRTPTNYCLDRSLPEMEAWMAELGWTPELPLAVDIETPETDKLPEDDAEDASYTIVRAGFSFREGTAASFPWTEPYIGLLKKMLAEAKTVIFHNAGYDVPRLVRANCPPLGKIVDTMWLWHWLQSDLPKALEFVAPFYTDVAPWKHLSSGEPAFYNATDNDVTLRCYYAMKLAVEKQGRWDRFEHHCVAMMPILARMSQAGVLIDLSARTVMQDKLREEIAELDAKIQPIIPESILPRKILKTLRTINKMPPEEQANWEPFEVVCCDKPKCRTCKGTGVTTHYRTSLRFNWQSTDQCQDLARSYHLKIPMKRGEDREALEAKTLKQFGKKHKVFLHILKAKQCNKLITTYNWELDEYNRTHTKIGFHPSTWRKSSRDPNLQNIPKRNELAKAFRRTIIAAPEHTLIEADAAAIEAVLVGYAANSPRFIALAKAGVHDFFMSHVRASKEGGRGIDPTLPFVDLIAACRAAKKYDASLPLSEQLRDICKRCIHGTHYGLTPYGMADEYPDEFSTQKDATQLQEMYFDLLPEIPAWMRSTRERADKQTFLDNHYQYRHYFFSVFTWDNSYGKWRLGPDGKRCIAFVPQSDGSAIQTEDVLALAVLEGIRDWLRLIIHDSVVLEVPNSQVPYACMMLNQVMSRPRPELGGLTIGVEINVGPNLADHEVWN